MLEFVEKIKGSKKDLWRCHCGVVKPMRTDNIKSGITKSCGCDRYKTRVDVPKYISRTFTLMKYRCENKNSKDYANYGGRGIQVAYLDYNDFYGDVGDRPDESYTIDRIDVNLNYEKGNCRWASQVEQMNNTRNNVYYVVDNEKLTIAQLSKKYNIKYTTLKERLKRGWDIKDALLKDVETKFNKRSGS